MISSKVICILALMTGNSLQFPASRRSRITMLEQLENNVESAYQEVSSEVQKAPQLISDELPSSLKEEVLNLTNGASQTLQDAGSFINTTFSSAIGGISDTAVAAEEFVTNTAVSAEDFVSSTATAAGDFVKNTYDDVSKEVSEVESEAENFFSSCWGSVTSWVSGAFSSVGNFFSSIWNTMQRWWAELEEEAKEFIHLIIKVVDVIIGVLIFLFICWVVYKVRKGYNLLL